MTSQQTPHPHLEENVRPLVQKVIDGIPPEHLKPPSSTETFDIPSNAWTRLQNYAFSQGFGSEMAWFPLHHSGIDESRILFYHT